MNTFHSYPWSKAALGFGLVVLFGFFFSCNVSRLADDAMQSVSNASPEIGEGLARGVVEGLDTTRLDSLVERLVASALHSLQDGLDSVQLERLESELSRVVERTLTQAKSDLTAPAFYDSLAAGIRPVLDEMDLQLQDIMQGLIPALLAESNREMLYDMRDSLLGPATSAMLAALINESLTRALTNPEIDSLFDKVQVITREAGNTVDEAAIQIKRSTLILGGVLAGLLLLALLFTFVRFRQKRKEAERKEDLVVRITKAIDQIPSREVYDQVVSRIKQQLSTGSSEEKLQTLLDEILEEYAGEYPEKQRYGNYYQRVTEMLKHSDQKRSIQQELSQAAGDDPDFQRFLEEELSG